MARLTWRDVWRAAVPLYSPSGLAALRDALEAGSESVLRGRITLPPCLAEGAAEAPCLACCPLCFPLRAACGIRTVRGVVTAFLEVAMYLDRKLGVNAHAVLTRWWDTGDPALRRAELLAEVRLALGEVEGE